MIDFSLVRSKQQLIVFVMTLLACFPLNFSSFTCLGSTNTDRQDNSIKKTTSQPGIKQQPQTDFTQADLMLDFLQSLAENKLNTENIEALLEAKGTDLIIKQMNVVRKVTRYQYKKVLTSLAQGKDTFPRLEPADSSERSKKGIAGLEKSVWPALRWAIGHRDILKEEIVALRGLDLYKKAQMLAMKYLPMHVEITPSIFVVMGGRAGFAALEGNNIYYDILFMTYLRSSRNRPAISNAELIESFAHEMHHLGLARIINQKRISLQLDDKQSEVFDFLYSLVAEGSASYLINGHRNLDLMRNNPSYSNYLRKTDELLGICEKAIGTVLKGGFKDENDYYRMTSPMLGHGYHSTGAAMLSIIDRVQGLESIMEILTDPRQ